jgi:CBS domain-containing protein
MRRHGIHRIVVTEGGRVQGIVSALDLLGALLDERGAADGGERA